MKCPHCNGEHPDDFKFCPVIGKEIVNELKACSNEECPDFGKHILPQEAKFCPRCGEQLAGIDNNKSKLNTLYDYFPVCGITLGKTTVEEAEKISYIFDKIEYYDDGRVIARCKKSDGYSGAQIRKKSGDFAFTEIYLMRRDEMFTAWAEIGFSWGLSYDEWVNLFQERGFLMDFGIGPQTTCYINDYSCLYLYAKIIVTAPDFSFRFVLDFSYAKNKTKTSDKGTLYSITAETNW